MTRIESLSAQPDRAGQYYAKLSDGTTLRLYRQSIEDFAVCPGRELSEEELASLKAGASALSAKMRAVRIVSAANVSKKDLKERLVRKGEDPDQADLLIQGRRIPVVDTADHAAAAAARHGVDAVIVADLGAFTLAGKYAPNCQRHISTQASISNYVTANAWYDLGASRVILARELSLEEIRTIRENTPAELEIEAFVHGAMCVSYSGRCLLSNYMTGRDASRGACAQPCRYQYALMEEKRPGEYFPIEEDEKGSYILNSRDMCMIDHLDDLLDVGLSSLKIEGRAKSAYYAAIVTGAYRHCLDDAAAGRPIDPVWRDEVEHVSHRPYATGFYYGYPGQYYENSRYIREWQVVALVTECDSDGNAVISLRNKFRTGDTVELVGPDLRPFSMTVPEMRDEAGTVIEEPRNPQMLLKLRLPRPVPPMTLVRHQVELSAK